MIEVIGNLWSYEPADARCITTNGMVRRDGHAVMGRGCAYEAKRKYPWLPEALGYAIKTEGNMVHVFRSDDPKVSLITFPVKHNWYEPADLDLIESSAWQLRTLIDLDDSLQNVILPRPGCGNGKLQWEKVRPVIARILDDRVKVISLS